MQVGKTSTPIRKAAKNVQEARYCQVLARLFERAGTGTHLADFEYCAEFLDGSPNTNWG